MVRIASPQARRAAHGRPMSTKARIARELPNSLKRIVGRISGRQADRSSVVTMVAPTRHMPRMTRVRRTSSQRYARFVRRVRSPPMSPAFGVPRGHGRGEAKRTRYPVRVLFPPLGPLLSIPPMSRVRTVDPARLPKHFEAAEAEERWHAHWDALGVHAYDPGRGREETFVVDTPPPTVSGSLHVGHVFSYTQTDVVVRYHRMQGRNVFYPMGWDD